MKTHNYDKIIIGGGLYGLYAALVCGLNNQRVALVEIEKSSFARATYINQARVHMGYHYPRSYSTAIKSARYFERFVNDFEECILSEFNQVYAISKDFSWTNAEQFIKFCRSANIRCEELVPSHYFKNNMVDGAFLTTEYTYDARALLNILESRIGCLDNVDRFYSTAIKKIEKQDGFFIFDASREFQADITLKAPFALNATYASVNQICQLLNIEPFDIKYELCEIILCDTNEHLQNTGITVMDGPFFSIMPFGLTGVHSLTSVAFTPHEASYTALPFFPCMEKTEGLHKCSTAQLANCNNCPQKPTTAWPYMSHLAQKYLRSDFEFSYKKSLFSMKPILKASEIDDSRPTVIKKHCENPTFVSVLCGKINTVYDLDEVLLA